MKIMLPETTVGSAAVQQVNVGQVKLGPARIGKISLSGTKLSASMGVAQLRNVRVTLTLTFSLKWTAGFVIDAGELGKIDLSQSGTMDLGKLDLGFGLGHVDLPGLADLKLNMADFSVADLEVVVGALKTLKLGAVLAERVRAKGLVAPTQGFQLGGGLGLASAGVQGAVVADASVDKVSVGRVSGGSLPIAGITVPGLAFPQVKVPSVTCQKFGSASNPLVTPLPEADVGVLKAQLTVTTTARFDVDELRLEDIKASASVAEVSLKNVELPFELLDLSLSQIGIESIGVPEMKVN
jgi:hypothetical protein